MDASGWDKRYDAQPNVWGVEPNRFVREQCQHLPPGDALDLACGEGRNALWLAGSGWRVIGVDFSSVAIQRARALTAKQQATPPLRLEWILADVTTFEPSPDSLDLALASYVHLPAPDRDAMLMRAATALRTGGHLLVVAHDKRILAEGVSGPQDIDLLYNPDDVRRLLADRCGLIVELASTVERPTPDGTALDTLVRARRG